MAIQFGRHRLASRARAIAPGDEMDYRSRHRGPSVPGEEMTMSIRFFLAALAVVAIPAMVGAQQQGTPRKQAPERRVCEAYSDINSKLSGRRRCQTRAERDALRQETRQVIDRIQNLKTSH
jgi:hypothetical protein